jgi:hypothetical protein
MTLQRRCLKMTAFMVVFAACGAHAEKQQVNEADIQKVIPVLRAEAAELTEGQAMVESAE